MVQIILKFLCGVFRYEGIQQIWRAVGLPELLHEEGKPWMNEMTSDAVINKYKTALLPTWTHMLKNRFMKKRMLDKCPVYIAIVKEIESIFTGSFHIWALRDPRCFLKR